MDSWTPTQQHLLASRKFNLWPAALSSFNNNNNVSMIPNLNLNLGLPASLWALQSISQPKDALTTASNEQLFLADFQRVVEQGNYPIYELALQQNPSYVKDPFFRLKFLRANNYDSFKAVQQMMTFLRLKVVHFGADKVAREITLEDLSAEELKILLSGQFHIQGERDQNGRIVLYCFNTKFGKCKTESQIRVNYYIFFNIILNMPEAFKGIVAVYYDLLKPGVDVGPLEMSSVKAVSDFMACIPVKFAATHLCLKATGEGTLALHSLFLALPSLAKDHAHLHYGSDLELQEKLRLYGLPQNDSPVDTFGRIREGLRNVWFHQYLKDIDQADDADDSSCSSEEEHPSSSSSSSSSKKSRKERSSSPGSLRAVSPSASHVAKAYAERSDELVVLPGSLSAGQLSHFVRALPLIGHDQVGVTINSSKAQNRVSSSSSSSSSTSSSDGQETKESSSKKDMFKQVPHPQFPSNLDVLLGKGYCIQSHVGNVMFRHFVENFQEEYNATPRQMRRQVSMDLVNMLLKVKGVRFWQLAPSGTWEEAGFDVIVAKVAQLLRTFRKHKQPSAAPSAAAAAGSLASLKNGSTNDTE